MFHAKEMESVKVFMTPWIELVSLSGLDNSQDFLAQVHSGEMDNVLLAVENASPAEDYRLIQLSCLLVLGRFEEAIDLAQGARNRLEKTLDRVSDEPLPSSRMADLAIVSIIARCIIAYHFNITVIIPSPAFFLSTAQTFDDNRLDEQSNYAHLGKNELDSHKPRWNLKMAAKLLRSVKDLVFVFELLDQELDQEMKKESRIKILYENLLEYCRPNLFNHIISTLKVGVQKKKHGGSHHLFHFPKYVSNFFIYISYQQMDGSTEKLIKKCLDILLYPIQRLLRDDPDVHFELDSSSLVFLEYFSSTNDLLPDLSRCNSSSSIYYYEAAYYLKQSFQLLHWFCPHFIQMFHQTCYPPFFQQEPDYLHLQKLLFRQYYDRAKERDIATFSSSPIPEGFLKRFRYMLLLTWSFYSQEKAGQILHILERQEDQEDGCRPLHELDLEEGCHWVGQLNLFVLMKKSKDKVIAHQLQMWNKIQKYASSFNLNQQRLISIVAFYFPPIEARQYQHRQSLQEDSNSSIVAPDLISLVIKEAACQGIAEQILHLSCTFAQENKIDADIVEVVQFCQLGMNPGFQHFWLSHLKSMFSDKNGISSSSFARKITTSASNRSKPSAQPSSAKSNLTLLQLPSQKQEHYGHSLLQKTQQSLPTLHLPTPVPIHSSSKSKSIISEIRSINKSQLCPLNYSSSKINSMDSSDIPSMHIQFLGSNKTVPLVAKDFCTTSTTRQHQQQVLPIGITNKPTAPQVLYVPDKLKSDPHLEAHVQNENVSQSNSPITLSSRSVGHQVNYTQMNTANHDTVNGSCQNLGHKDVAVDQGKDKMWKSLIRKPFPKYIDLGKESKSPFLEVMQGREEESMSSKNQDGHDSFSWEKIERMMNEMMINEEDDVIESDTDEELQNQDGESEKDFDDQKPEHLKEKMKDMGNRLVSIEKSVDMIDRAFQNSHEVGFADLSHKRMSQILKL